MITLQGRIARLTILFPSSTLWGMPPRAFLEHKPTKQSILFGGRYINLTHLAIHLGVDPGNLSRVFSGKGRPSLQYATRLADALHMTLDAFTSDLARLKQSKEEKIRDIA